MGGHKWVPQNRGLNVCTSGFGCTSCAAAYFYNSPTSPSNDNALRASPVSAASWLLPFLVNFLSLARVTIFALLILAFLPGAKAMDMTPLGVLASPAGGGSALTAVAAAGAAGAAALALLSARLQKKRGGAKAAPGVKGFPRRESSAAAPAAPLDAPSSPSEPAAPPPIKKGRSTSPAPAAAALAQESLWGKFFGGKAAAPPPSPASRFAFPDAVFVPRAPFRPYVNAGHKRPLGSPLSSPAPLPRVFPSPRLPLPSGSPAGPAARSPSQPRSFASGSPLKAVRQQLSFAEPSSAPSSAAPAPTSARALPSAAALLCGAPLTVTTSTGTATLALSREHGLVWGVSSVTGEVSGSNLLDFVAPFNGDVPQRMLKSGALVKELLVLGNPARSVCLSSRGGH